MKREQEKKEIEDMESRKVTSNTIEFTKYAPLDQDYSKKELAECCCMGFSGLKQRKGDRIEGIFK